LTPPAFQAAAEFRDCPLAGFADMRLASRRGRNLPHATCHVLLFPSILLESDGVAVVNFRARIRLQFP
jgi:hypothetical protein